MSYRLKNRARALTSALAVGGAAAVSLVVGGGAAQAAPTTEPDMAVVADGQSYWPSPYQVCGEIRDLYVSLGATSGTLSFPTAPEVTNPDGSKRQAFVGGAIVWTAATGAYVE